MADVCKTVASWPQLESFMYMSNLVDFLGVMGCKRILEFRQDWNEAVIPQFYAMLVVRVQKEKLIWMTHTCMFKATFKDFVATVKLRSLGMKRGKLVLDLPVLGTYEVSIFC